MAFRDTFTRFVTGIMVCLAMGVGVVQAAEEPETPGAPASFRRLTADQYQNIIANVFGRAIRIEGRFEPNLRKDGLLAVGTSAVSITASGLENYEAMARGIAAQVVDAKSRDILLPCTPANAKASDEACAAAIIRKVGPLLYRRPLKDVETQHLMSTASTAAASAKDFYAGVEMVLVSMLTSPQFLFRHADTETKGGQYQLTSYAKASQLSFFLWNTAPDSELLAAAARGDLENERGLKRQVDRMLASPRLEGGIRAFFADMLGFEAFDTLSKDGTIYPKFTTHVAKDAQEQTLRTIVYHLLTQHGDYRDLFTSRTTFLTPTLGSLYGVQVMKSTPNGAPDSWQLYEYPAGDARAGLLAHASFVALHSHPGRSSPTIRGKALRELLMCQKVPDPPGEVDFSVVQQTDNELHKTARARLLAHSNEPMCAGCHKLTDPIGLALEVFDGGGSFRTAENGAPIDTSGQFEGVSFDGPAGLNEALRNAPSIPACLVNRMYSYGMGRAVARNEAAFIKYLQAAFAGGGYKLPELMRTIAMSDAFYRVAKPLTQTTAR